MDSFTHILTGIAVGQVFSENDDKAKPLVWGAIAGSIPDLDAIFQPFMSPENSMFFHRGISHSLLVWALCSPLLALLINKIDKGDRHSYFKWLKISVVAWFSHIFLDIFNTYGTGIFEPFSHVRIAYDAVNVIDLLYMIPLLTISVFFVFIIGDWMKKRIAALSALAFSLFYIMFAILVKINVETSAKIQFVMTDVNPVRVISSPLPLSTLAWKIVAETDTEYHTGIFYGFWKERATFTVIPKNRLLEKEFEKYDNFQTLKQFTKNCYVIRYTDGQTTLCDLRFSSLSPECDALCFPLHIRENTLEIGRASLNRHVTFKNIRDHYKRLFN
ncbi:MAG: metal-dependent hydrolase [Prevotellaceae bacterium]|jgi:inner membrane protein|nr:metal-dependent hydrolase [Prevotellaceae bacterium]